MTYPAVIHHGGVESVTGSCHQLVCDDHNSILIDCGLRLESDGLASASAATAIEFALHTIQALVLTHVHVDHAGRIPDLLDAGYRGPIICSEASASMLPIMLEDASKHRFSDDEKALARHLSLVQAQTLALPFNVWHVVVQSPELVVKTRLQRAGHILGSAYVEFDIQYPLQQRDRRVVFSGDLGSSGNPLLRSPVSPERADTLVLESTYGDRHHDSRSDRQQRLEQVIDRALKDHGTILIPAFSIGRTQELLFEIEDILRRKSLLGEGDACVDNLDDAGLPIDWPQPPVILDSPLASRFTAVYQRFDSYWNVSAQERLSQGRTPLGFRQLITVDSHDKHQMVVNYLSSTGRPAIVIAGSGMCSGGRIVNYLKAMLGDSRHNVVFVGYQAKGTPGAAIQKYGPVQGYVELDKDRFQIKAGITTVGGYSAHADQAALVNFATGMEQWPAELILVHGEPAAKKALGNVFERKYALAKQALKLVIPVAA
jgi:metallo-beta-lactamase family protein